MTKYLVKVEVDDEHPRAQLNRQLVTASLATVLQSGVLDGVSVTVHASRRGQDSTIVRVRDGRVRTELERRSRATSE